jgi:putative ABC transport system ATP-binding protein
MDGDGNAIFGDALLQARGLTAAREAEGGSRLVLDAVDLDVAAGTLTDVVGPSGSGKTTLLLALARLLPGARGTLALDGRDASALTPQQWRAEVAYLPQVATLVAGSVADNLLLPWRLKVRAEQPAPTPAELRAALDGVVLADVGLERDASRLSVGQAARVALLRVVLTRPRVLLADEPDAALDDESAEQVARLTDAFVRDGGAVVRVRHLRVDERADRRFRLEHGRLEEVDARG